MVSFVSQPLSSINFLTQTFVFPRKTNENMPNLRFLLSIVIMSYISVKVVQGISLGKNKTGAGRISSVVHSKVIFFHFSTNYRDVNWWVIAANKFVLIFLITQLYLTNQKTESDLWINFKSQNSDEIGYYSIKI